MQLLIIRTITGAALLAAALAIPSAAAAADKIFLQFKNPSGPAVPLPVGESTVVGRKDWIEVDNYSWGVANTVSFSSRGGGAAAGKVEFNELSISKPVDKATNSLLQAACLGGIYGEATLVVVRDAGTGTLVEYLKLEMKDILVSSVSMTALAGADRSEENVTLAFGSMQSTYTPFDLTGKPATPVIAKWSVITNKLAFRPAEESKADPVPAGSPPASTGTKITVK